MCHGDVRSIHEENDCRTRQSEARAEKFANGGHHVLRSCAATAVSRVEEQDANVTSTQATSDLMVPTDQRNQLSQDVLVNGEWLNEVHWHRPCKLGVFGQR